MIPNPGMKQTLRIAEAAEALSISRRQVYYLLDDGQLEAVVVGRGATRLHRRVLGRSVQRFLDTQARV